MPLNEIIADDPEVFWESLLAYIDDGNVIPIVGAELLEVRHEGRTKPLYGYVAERLADRLLPDERLPETLTLNDVVCHYKERPGHRIGNIFTHVRAIMRDAELEPPEALRKLARIEPFNLFVTLTFDSLLKRAIDEVRFGGEDRTVELAYSLGRAEDLPRPKSQLRTPVVYHLFGKVSSAFRDYVVTDEDMLEFLHHIQPGSRRPSLLFDDLKRSHLLFIGCNFSNWLTRFFLRIVKGQELSRDRAEKTEVLVDPLAAHGGRLAVFLTHFSVGTTIIARPAAEFVTELEERYTARLVQSGGPPRAPEPAGIEANDTAVPAGAAFISYASEDYEAAARLKDSLEEFGVEVWFDKLRLESGDRFEKKIERGIKRSACFIPLISASSAGRREGFFRLEWNLALERAKQMDDAEQFIMPVRIDDTKPDAAGIPPLFAELHAVLLEGGEATQRFAATVSRRQRQYRARMAD